MLNKAIRKWTWRSYFVQHIACFSLYVIYNVHVNKLNPQLYHYLFECSVNIDKRISNLAQLSLMPHYSIAVYTHALVSLKKYMSPPLPYFKVNICPYFKVNICPLPLPHFASIFFAYFADPIISLHSRDISLFDCHI